MMRKLSKVWPPYTPIIDSPYPPFPVARITKFDFDTHLHIARNKYKITTSRDREEEYVVYAEYRCSMTIHSANDPLHEEKWRIEVPAGLISDLTSIPWFLRIFAGRVGRHLEAAIIHDYLFTAWQIMPGYGPRKDDFDFANLVMDVAMRKAEVAAWRRIGILIAVQSGIGRCIYDDPNKPPHFVRPDDPGEPFARDVETAERLWAAYRAPRR